MWYFVHNESPDFANEADQQSGAVDITNEPDGVMEVEVDMEDVEMEMGGEGASAEAAEGAEAVDGEYRGSGD